MILGRLREDIGAFKANDPAARSAVEVVLAYPGFHVLLTHRLANRLFRGGHRLLARLVSHLGRWLTGIEIHPGATIGRRLVIDHGMGVVIGETARVGDDVLIYQGVTLGGTSRNAGPRHPSVGNRVVIGAGATILGPIRVNDGAQVGSGAVVVQDVPAGATVGGVPARILRERHPETGQVIRVVSPEELAASLRDQVVTLESRVERLERAGDRCTSATI